jgi:hypothetical protein
VDTFGWIGNDGLFFGNMKQIKHFVKNNYAGELDKFTWKLPGLLTVGRCFFPYLDAVLPPDIEAYMAGFSTCYDGFMYEKRVFLKSTYEFNRL